MKTYNLEISRLVDKEVRLCLQVGMFPSRWQCSTYKSRQPPFNMPHYNTLSNIYYYFFTI